MPASAEVVAAVEASSFRQLCQSEIENLDATVLCDEQVFGLQIAMNDAHVMCRRQSATNLDGVLDNFLGRQRALGGRAAQRLAFQELRDDVRLAVVCAKVVHGDDVGVVQRGGRTGFLLESAEPIGVGTEDQRHDLDRNVPAEPRIVRPIYLAHAAGAERGNDFVAADPFAGLEPHRRRAC